MKTVLTTLSILFLFYTSLNAQSASAVDLLNANNTNMLIYSNGEICQDSANFTPGFEAPKGSGIYSIYSSSLWIMGINSSNNELHGYSELYKRNNISEGPIANSYDSTWKNNYGRTWRIEKNEVELHKQNWNQPGYNIITSVEEWPAHGDTANGEAFYLAPFIDVNRNNIYDPLNGDYPCIKGDLAIYTISNDDKASNLGRKPLKIERHLMAYSFNTTDPVNNAVFLEYKLVNRSTNDYEDLYIGLYQDYDVGCSSDDYIGCDSTLNTFFAYNGLNYDWDCNGASGYLANPPFIGTVFLDNKMSSFISFQNAGGVQGDPISDLNFYNYMQAIWRDGSDLVIGGNGHVNNSHATNIKTKYMFPGDPRDTSMWSDLTAFNSPSDRKGLGSTGPYTMKSGESIILNMAMVFSQDSTKVDYDLIDNFKSDVTFVQQFFDNNNYDCSYWATGLTSQAPEIEVNIYPNPSSDHVNIELSENQDILSFQIFDSFGRKVYERNGLRDSFLEIDVSSFHSGVHIIHLRTESENLMHKLIIQ